MQTDLKIKQTSANIKLSIAFNISAVYCKYPKSGHFPNNSIYSYTGCAIALQDVKVFIIRQENILIGTYLNHPK